MKFIKEEIADIKGKEKTRYLFALGKNEAIVLKGLLEKAKRYTPYTFETGSLGRRIANMLSVISKAIGEMTNYED